MHDGRIEWWWATYVRIFRHHCWYYCLLKSVCVCLCCARVCVHADSLWDSTKPWKPPGVLPACGGPPLFSLKAATVQLRLRYTTMWQSHTRANICDLDATFKYGPIDGSFFLFFIFFCSTLFYKFKCKLIPRRSPWRARLRRGRRPCRCCAFPNLSLFKPQTLKWERGDFDA